MKNKYIWSRTNTKKVTRHDDIWFTSSKIGWAINSDGKIIFTDNAGESWRTVCSDANAYYRCITVSPSGRAWVGAIQPRSKRLWYSADGQSWAAIDNSALPDQPTAICGICSVNEDVVYASGTQYPNRPAAIMKTTDQGKSWSVIDMDAHADLLIDIYFTDEQNGWVVGGRGGDRYDMLKPVVLKTSDGGETWTNKLKHSGIAFPSGEWGWKIQFLDNNLGFVSTENEYAAAILKTIDGGETWERLPVNDAQGNANLEGIGFLDKNIGWVGGWGAAFPQTPGYSSGTIDGGRNWFDANEIGLFINRFRFTGESPIVAYSAGEHVYRCEVIAEGASAEHLSSDPIGRVRENMAVPVVTRSLDIQINVPKGTESLRAVCFDRRLRIAHVFCDEKKPAAGLREFSWDFATDSGEDAGLGYFVYRISIDNDATSEIVARVARIESSELGSRVAQMITDYARFAKRSHGELILPDASGQPQSLRMLFDDPIELMASMIRGGWVVPFYPDRSMLLESIIGKGAFRGPMDGALTEIDVKLLEDWIASGAELPASEVMTS